MTKTKMPHLAEEHAEQLEDVNWDNLSLFDFNEAGCTVQENGRGNLTVYLPDKTSRQVKETNGNGYLVEDDRGLHSRFTYISHAVWFCGYLQGLYSPSQT